MLASFNKALDWLAGSRRPCERGLRAWERSDRRWRALWRRKIHDQRNTKRQNGRSTATNKKTARAARMLMNTHAKESRGSPSSLPKRLLWRFVPHWASSLPGPAAIRLRIRRRGLLSRIDAVLAAGTARASRPSLLRFHQGLALMLIAMGLASNGFFGLNFLSAHELCNNLSRIVGGLATLALVSGARRFWQYEMERHPVSMAQRPARLATMTQELAALETDIEREALIRKIRGTTTSEKTSTARKRL